MKKTHLLLGAVFLLSCSTENSNTPELERPANVSVTTSKKSMDDLINLYPAIDFDTLWVYSSTNPEGDSDFEYAGTILDTVFFSLFPKGIREYMYNEPEVFACYKINVDPNYVGLVTRTPSEYIPSSIKLFLVDRRSSCIVETFELAESWGDAGDSMTKDSWLYRNTENQLEWLFNRQDCWYEREDADEPECVDSLAVFTSFKGKITPVSREKKELVAMKQRLTKN